MRSSYLSCYLQTHQKKAECLFLYRPDWCFPLCIASIKKIPYIPEEALPPDVPYNRVNKILELDIENSPGQSAPVKLIGKSDTLVLKAGKWEHSSEASVTVTPHHSRAPTERCHRDDTQQLSCQCDGCKTSHQFQFTGGRSLHVVV